MIIVLIVVGLGLIAVDFYLPGFVLGTVGVVLMLLAVWICFSTTGDLGLTVGLLVAEVVLGFAVAWLSIKVFPTTAAGKKMILSHDQTGVRAQAAPPLATVGQEGVAQTVLRPAGVATFDGKRVDVVAESGMIASGSPVKVVAVQENQIVVKQL